MKNKWGEEVQKKKKKRKGKNIRSLKRTICFDIKKSFSFISVIQSYIFLFTVPYFSPLKINM